MASNADPYHPKGPEDKRFHERSIEFRGEGRRATMTLAYPEPDEIVDWVRDGVFDVYGPYRPPLTLNFNFSGRFWQGVFGRVGLDIDLLRKKLGTPEWNDLPDLLSALRIQQAQANGITMNDTSNSRQKWLAPEMIVLNGIPCIRESVVVGNNPGGTIRYYLLFDKNIAIELDFSLIDNSDREGLPKSDWRPRAEQFLTRLVSTITFRLEGSASQ